VKNPSRILALACGLLGAVLFGVPAVQAEGDVHRINHIIVIMQENHSFDNYLGVLPYVPGTPYHPGPCAKTDHQCVDGLSCASNKDGSLSCWNSNVDDDGSLVFSFHDQNYCPSPDLQHNWPGSHMEANFADPADTFNVTLNDGFVLTNDAQEQIDHGESATEDEQLGSIPLEAATRAPSAGLVRTARLPASWPSFSTANSDQSRSCIGSSVDCLCQRG